MLARPDVGSLEHQKLWVGNHPVDEPYVWASGDCPACRYSREFGSEFVGLNLERLNNIAEPLPHTYGALRERMGS